jgi:hypothetical protein
MIMWNVKGVSFVMIKLDGFGVALCMMDLFFPWIYVVLFCIALFLLLMWGIGFKHAVVS